jgi:AraC-like DNA-binding protein
MVHELYNILSIFVTGGLFLAYGLLFLFTAISDSPLLGNYRKARYAMAGAYLFFVAVEIIKYLFGDLSGHNIALLQAVSLTISVSQAFLFTFAMLALMEVRFPGWPYIFRESLPALLLAAAVFTVYAFCPETLFSAAFYGFAGIYALLLVRYTFLFVRSYRLFRTRMDNYYSDEESGRLSWVVFSFFAALTIGVMALLTSVFISTLAALIFTIVFDIFYTFFAIRFLNYPHLFQTVIGQVMEDETPETLQAGNDGKTGGDTFALLEKRLEHWAVGKGFTETGITIDILAAKLATNHKYLSTHINTHKKRTFRKWINELRIEEAKIILLQEQGMTLTEIAHRTGYSDKSHFLRLFKEQTGMSPTEWRKQPRT